MSKENIIVELLGSFGSDRDIANAAWTSSLEQQAKEQRAEAEVERVVAYLIKNRHSSPIEQVAYRFYLKMPIFVSRQFMRHRLQSPNEMSGRYRSIPNDFLNLPKDILDIASKLGDNNLEQEWQEIHQKEYQFYENKINSYKEAMEKGKISNYQYKRLREIIRGVLGTSFATKVTTVFNLRSLANFFRLRLAEDAQPEIRLLAEKMLLLVEKENNCPFAIKYLKENAWQI